MASRTASVKSPKPVSIGVTIDRAAIPVDPSARTWFEARDVDPVAEALAGGDDYELVFTAPPKLGGRLRTVARHGGVAITRIGICTRATVATDRTTRDGHSTSEPLP